jgi:hypothetical protein
MLAEALMSRVSTVLGAAVIAGVMSTSVFAQLPPAKDGVVTYSSVLSYKQQYTHIKDMLLKMADLMPEDGYAFQPVPTVRTFAADMGHIASSNIGQCASILGTKHPLQGQKLEETLKTKAETIEALKAGFTLCDDVFNSLESRGNLMDEGYTVNAKNRDGSPLTIKMGYAGSLAGLIGHNNEMYGYMSMYLRLKGIVPPSSKQ